MFNPGVVYMLASVLLFAVAVVVHFHSRHLSLPLSPAMTIVAVVLPIAAFINAYMYPSLLRSSRACTSPDPLARLAPVVLQALQAIATAVLATLLLDGLASPPTLDFLLQRAWDSLFAARDATSIRLIQDTYCCCGLDAVDDRAYPFHGQPCPEAYGRSRSCMAPWKRAMQATSAVDLAVVLVVGLMQILGLLAMRERTAWWTALRTQGWKETDAGDDSSQRLLPDEGIARRSSQAYGALEGTEPRPNTAPGGHTSSTQ